jgi:hypothetical protein
MVYFDLWHLWELTLVIGGKHYLCISSDLQYVFASRY